MNKDITLSIIIPVIIGIGLSAVFVVDYFSGGPVTNIDSEILEFYADFMLQSNTHVYAVNLVDDHPIILIIVSKTLDGYIVMDDPLPLFRELYPDENITTLIVFAGRNKIPYDIEDNILRFNTGNEEDLLIRGE